MSTDVASDGLLYRWHRRLALLSLCLMLVVPFLIAYHRLPIPSFYEEWWTGIFGLATMSVLLHRRHAFQLPRIALLPAILMVCLTVQIILADGKTSNPAQIALLCLAWALGLMLAVTALRNEIGVERLTRMVAWSLLAGGLLAVFAAVLQVTGSWSGLGLIMPMRSGQIYGNVGQPNHLSDQLWLGIASAIYLRANERLSAPLAAAVIALLSATCIFTGTRSVWLYAIALVALALFVRRRSPATGDQLVLWCVAALAFQLASQLVLPGLLPADMQLMSSGERLYTLSGNGTGSVRFGLWTMAYRTWLEHPLLGAGWGSFPAQTYAFIGSLAAELPAGIAFHPGENAHNIVFAMFSELGLVAGVAIVAIPLAWLLKLLRRPSSTEQFLVLGLLLVIGLHSQLEYPLWYLNFLAIATLAGTLAEPTDWLTRPRRLAPPVLAVMLVAGATALGVLRHDYQRLEAALFWPLTADGGTPQPWETVRHELVELRGQTLFSGYVDLALAGTMSVDRDGLADKITVAELAMRFSPTDRVVFKYAALLALAGKAEAAREAWRRARAAYPEAAPQADQAVTELGKRFPEISALRDLAPATGE